MTRITLVLVLLAFAASLSRGQSIVINDFGGSVEATGSAGAGFVILNNNAPLLVSEGEGQAFSEFAELSQGTSSQEVSGSAAREGAASRAAASVSVSSSGVNARASGITSYDGISNIAFSTAGSGFNVRYLGTGAGDIRFIGFIDASGIAVSQLAINGISTRAFGSSDAFRGSIPANGGLASLQLAGGVFYGSEASLDGSQSNGLGNVQVDVAIGSFPGDSPIFRLPYTPPISPDSPGGFTLSTGVFDDSDGFADYGLVNPVYTGGADLTPLEASLLAGSSDTSISRARFDFVSSDNAFTSLTIPAGTFASDAFELTYGDNTYTVAEGEHFSFVESGGPVEAFTVAGEVAVGLFDGAPITTGLTFSSSGVASIHVIVTTVPEPSSLSILVLSSLFCTLRHRNTYPREGRICVI